MINKFINWLRKNNEDECYDTNKQFARDIGVKTAFENMFNFWDLVDQAPEELYNKKDDCDVSLDVLWAEEQIDDAFDKA